MVDIPEKSEAPLTRDTVLSVNRKRVRGALDSRSIAELNRPAPSSQNETGHPRPPAPPAQQRPTPAPPAQRRPAPPPDSGRNGPTMPPDMAIPPLMKPVQKGQKVPLEANGRIQRIKVCMGWNVSDPNCDVDVSAFLLNNGRVLGDAWFVFYGQDVSPDGSTRFSANAAPDRELISVDFTRLDPAVDRIAFILTINEALEKRLNFSMIRDAYVRLIDGTSNRELVSFRIEESYANVTSMTIGEIYLHNGAWKFNAVGNGVGKDLAGLCQMYGVQVE